MLILVHQPAETVTAPYRQRLRAGPLFSRRSTVGWRKIQAAVRTMAVVVIDKHGQRQFEMLRVHDQHPIKTFGSDSSDEPFRDPVGLRHLNRRANDSGL